MLIYLLFSHRTPSGFIMRTLPIWVRASAYLIPFRLVIINFVNKYPQRDES